MRGPQVTSQRCPVGAGALHPSPTQHTEPRCPDQQLLITGSGRREAGGAQQPSQCVDHRCDVKIFVRVHPEDDLLRVDVGLAEVGCLGHPGHGCSSPARLGNGWPSPGRQGGQDCDGALLAARPLSGHATPVRRQQAPPQAWVDRSIPRHHGQSYRGSDPGPGWHPNILTVVSDGDGAVALELVDGVLDVVALFVEVGLKLGVAARRRGPDAASWPVGCWVRGWWP